MVQKKDGEKQPVRRIGSVETGNRQINEQKTLTSNHFRDKIALRPKPDTKPREG